MSLKISQLTSLATPASGDLLPIVDIDDATMAPSGTDKAITVSGLLGFLGFGLLASTGAAGYSKTNSTANILSWTAPSDGNLHRAMCFYASHVTVAETGGQVTFGSQSTGGGGTLIDSSAGWATVDNGGNGTGLRASQNVSYLMVAAGSTIYLYQATALTAGTTKLFAEIWGG